MKKLLLTLLASLSLAAPAFASSEGPAWDTFPKERVTDLAALQNGAKLFVNYCLNCHSASYMRFNRMHDIGLTDQQIKDNLVFTGVKVGDLMKNSLDPKEAKDWFGAVPPDLTLVARSRAGHGGTGADYLYTYIDDFWAALASGDPAWQDAIDLDSWVDNHILNLYPKNPDALRLSQYYYKDREGPIVAGPLWDFDRTSGCTSDDRAEDPTWWDPSNQTTDTTYMFEYGWYESLFNDPTFAAAYWARWDEMLDYPLSVEHVNGVIDEMAAELSEAAPRNYDRWPEVGPTTGSFEGEIAALEDWFDARHAWIASCLADHPDDPRTCEGD